MPNNESESGSANSGLAKKIGVITGIVVALTALTTAVVKFRDAIPWLTPVNTIELTPNPANLAIGDKFQVIATVRDANKNQLGKRVSWSSANPSLVEIDSDGIITGVAAGETTITASIGMIKGLVPVHVRRVTVAMVDVFPPATTLRVEDHLKFDATPYDSEGNSLLGRPVRWASENNLVAAVDQSSGEATGRSGGSVKITAESEGKLNSAQVTVSPKSTPMAPREAPKSTATVFAAPPPPPPNQAAGPAKTGAEAGRLVTARPPVGAVASFSRASNLAFAETIVIAKGLKFGECPANVRILVGETLIDIKSDPQEAARIPLGDQPYKLHGTVSCPGQTVGVVNGHGTISVANGKAYRCNWLRKGSKDFEINLQPE
ncbi:MAG: Ig-like domain-containing protein [Candidatus Acidiferrum sp.]